MNGLLKMDATTALRLEGLFLAMLIVGCAGVAMAASGTADLPWDAGVDKFTDSIKGPIAKGAAIVAVVLCGIAMAKGAAMDGIGNRVLSLVMALAMVVLAEDFVEKLFPGGALFPY